MGSWWEIVPCAYIQHELLYPANYGGACFITAVRQVLTTYGIYYTYFRQHNLDIIRLMTCKWGLKWRANSERDISLKKCQSVLLDYASRLWERFTYICIASVLAESFAWSKSDERHLSTWPRPSRWNTELLKVLDALLICGRSEGSSRASERENRIIILGSICRSFKFVTVWFRRWWYRV